MDDRESKDDELDDSLAGEPSRLAHPGDGTFDEYLQFVREQAPWLFRLFRGADAWAIEQFREAAWHPLPPLYVEFLRHMGVYSGGAVMFADDHDDIFTMLDWFRDRSSDPDCAPIAGYLPISSSAFADPLFLRLDDPRLPVYRSAPNGIRQADGFLPFLRQMTEQFIARRDGEGRRKLP